MDRSAASEPGVAGGCDSLRLQALAGFPVSVRLRPTPCNRWGLGVESDILSFLDCAEVSPYVKSDQLFVAKRTWIKKIGIKPLPSARLLTVEQSSMRLA